MRNYKAQQLTEHGRLKIGTFAVDVGRPASHAVVRISSNGSNGSILEELVTDSSGQSDTLELAAPPLEFSMSGDFKPYSEYDVSVMMDGYEPQIIEGVQILPHETAYQDIFLKPVTGGNIQTNIISVKEHALWGTFPPKIPEEEEKDISPSTGFVVLPEPVIPEYIVVHDGSPTNASAPNYWVPFADYIKNVASCEIYATWPQATITANVLAILSFTLNRVYTEWYRGKGYNFTVTSSTAYDQAFSYGRNIFSEISSVVDHIFTHFIVRQGMRQPLLTQYCDGKRVFCDNWMSQWGSKALGEQGYAAIDILKNYYGYDIYLKQAQKVAGVPSSYPNTALRVGSSGRYVRTIQEQLNAISNHYPAISKIKVDGIFGNETKNAVETFQKIFRLSPDGVVGFATWYKISDIYTAVTRIAELI